METTLPILHLLVIVIALQITRKTDTWWYGLGVFVFISGVFSILWGTIGGQDVGLTQPSIMTALTFPIVVLWVRKVLRHYRPSTTEEPA